MLNDEISLEYKKSGSILGHSQSAKTFSADVKLKTQILQACVFLLKD